MPADWQLPTGVSRALQDYFHDPESARNYDTSLDGTPLLAPGEEGLKDTIVVEAIYRSVAAGQKVKVGS